MSHPATNPMSTETDEDTNPVVKKEYRAKRERKAREEKRQARNTAWTDIAAAVYRH